MLKTIEGVAPGLDAFVGALRLPLNASRRQHVIQIADGLVTRYGSKTPSALHRHIVGNPCPKSAADTFCKAPWQALQGV
jgi:hypothetical protein